MLGAIYYFGFSVIVSAVSTWESTAGFGFEHSLINRPACREHGVDLANIVYRIDVSLLLSEGIYLFYLCFFSSGRL